MAVNKLSSSSFFNSSKSQLSVDAQQDFACFCDSVGVEKKGTESSDEDSSEEIENEKIKRSLWETIIQESKELTASYEEWLREDVEISTKNHDSPVDYLEREVFPILLIAMEKTLSRARDLNVLEVQKCRFNGLDSLAEYLWNKNPRWPTRNKWLEVYDIPQFKLSMRLHPRPIFPKSWLWSTEEAASRIQRYVRGWLVRKREDVQELRQFWKLIRDDKESLDYSDNSAKSGALDICERYKLMAKKRDKPF